MPPGVIARLEAFVITLTRLFMGLYFPDLPLGEVTEEDREYMRQAIKLALTVSLGVFSYSFVVFPYLSRGSVHVRQTNRSMSFVLFTSFGAGGGKDGPEPHGRLCYCQGWRRKFPFCFEIPSIGQVGSIFP